MPRLTSDRSSGVLLSALARLGKTGWLKGSAKPRTGDRRVPMIRRIDGWAPRTADERCLLSALDKNGYDSVPLDQLVDDLVEELLNSAISNGGWIVDIGLWGRWSLREEALRLINACIGLAVVLDEG